MPKEEALIKLFYLLAAVLFIFGLKGLMHPRTAVRGNLLAALGMLLAIVVTLTDKRIVDFRTIIAGMVVGGLIGSFMAYRSAMTSMPQVVAVFNGFGGGASALAVGAALEEAVRGEWIEQVTVQFTSSAAAAALIGGISLTGSAVAFGKLQGLISERPILIPGRHLINLTLLLVCLLLGGWQVVGYAPLAFTGGLATTAVDGDVPDVMRQSFQSNAIDLSATARLSSDESSGDFLLADSEQKQTFLIKQQDGKFSIHTRSALPFWIMVILSCVLGIMLVIPIGGADMPVVISLLNAYSGIAAAGHGWVLNKSVLIIAGSLVGAAGFILTVLMCRAMNRSLANVAFAGVGAAAATEDQVDDIYVGRVKSASSEGVAMMLDGARRVVIAPGYGMAVAQA